MRQTKNIPWNDSDITVKELTVAELASVLDHSTTTADPIDLLFGQRLPSQAVVLSSGLKLAELHALPPSQLDRLISAAEEVNPFFVQALRRLLPQLDQPPAAAPGNN